MFSIIYVLCLPIIFQIITAQGNQVIPPQCRGPPPPVERPHECCALPPFFEDEEFQECGFVKLDGKSSPPKQGPPDCSKQLCMLKRHNLVKEDEKIDVEAFNAFLNAWSAENPPFEAAVGLAKERCVGKDLPGPPGLCDANKLLFCVSSTLFMECPIWSEADNCSKLKSHFDKCKPYFNS